MSVPVFLYAYYFYVIIYRHAVSSSRCPILFMVLTLNVAICIVRLHFSDFCFSLSSVVDFLKTEVRAPTSIGCVPFLSVQRAMQFGLVVWVWVMVIFWWLFLFSSLEAILIDEQQLFPDWTIWSLLLNHRIHIPKAWLGIGLNCQRVYLLTFISTMLLSMAFEKISPLLLLSSVNIKF